MAKQAVRGQRRQRAEHAAEGDVAAGSETGRGAVEYAERRQGAFIRPSASGPHLGRGIFDRARRSVRGGRQRLGPRRLVRGEFARRLLVIWFCHTPLLERLAKRIELDPKLLGHFAPTPAGAEQLLGLGRRLRCHHAGATRPTWLVERFHPSFAILRHDTLDAVGRHPERANDLRLLARPLADKLRREHAKRAAILFRVVKHRLHAAKVRPLALFANDAEPLADSSGAWTDQRQ